GGTLQRQELTISGSVLPQKRNSKPKLMPWAQKSVELKSVCDQSSDGRGNDRSQEQQGPRIRPGPLDNAKVRVGLDELLQFFFAQQRGELAAEQPAAVCLSAAVNHPPAST